MPDLAWADEYRNKVPTNAAFFFATIGKIDARIGLLRAALAGIYRFEVRRWPREADAPLAGTPKITKTVDAWDVGGPKPDLLYGSKNTKFTALPVAAVRLNVDGKSQTLPTPEGVKEAVFDLELKVGRTCTVQAELLNGSGKTLAGGYYVYCRRE